MALLWVLVVLVVIFAIIGGAAVNNWLFLLLIIAVVLALVGAFWGGNAMPEKGDVHVVRGNSGGWQVRVEGTARARSIHKTQAEAAKAGADLARRNKSELLVHGRDGKIRERSAYGHDPRRTTG
jgi:Uncharacterized protein conserved in bacteria (DUF2188)